mgnify:CR=1 FL=1
MAASFLVLPLALLLLLPGLLLLVSDLIQRGIAQGADGGHLSEDTLHPSDVAQLPTFLILVPAHEEQEVIEACVTSLQRQDYPSQAYRPVVIADNCSDKTADIARACGIDCLERQDRTNRGKPYALAWAIEQLELGEWDYVVVVDADTKASSDFTAALAEAALASNGHPHFQAYYGLSNTDDSWLTQLSNLLVKVRYEALYPLKQMAGLNCPLTGNGMCFRADALDDEGWTFFSLTENWEAYARLTLSGEQIEFVPNARLFAEETPSANQSATRRQRWLAGRYGVLARTAYPLATSREIGWLQKLDSLAELSYPGPILHADAVLAVTLLGYLTFPLQWATVLAAIGLMTLMPVSLPALVIARREDNLTPLLKSLTRLPFYAVWRLGLAALTALRGLTGIEWEKTDRSPPL